jgi:hypothetical protein
MSIAAMTEVAFQSPKGVGGAEYFPKTLTQVSGAAGAKGTPDNDVNTALRTLERPRRVGDRTGNQASSPPPRLTYTPELG